MSRTRVKLSRDGVTGGRLRRKQEIVEVDPWTAERMVEAGEASYLIRVRARKDGIVVGSKVLDAGEIATVADSRALALHKTGHFEILNPEDMTSENAAQAREVVPIPTPKEVPQLAEPETLKIKLQPGRSILAGRTVLGPYDAPTVIAVSEPIAKAAVAGGIAEFVGLAAVTAGVARAVRNLSSSAPGLDESRRDSANFPSP
jgi:hypothetical protein